MRLTDPMRPQHPRQTPAPRDATPDAPRRGEMASPSPIAAGDGPRRSTLAELVTIFGTTMFEPIGAGWAELTAPKSELAAAMGISKSALSARLKVLTAAGLACRSGRRLLVDVHGAGARLESGAVSARGEQARSKLGEVFARYLDADGTVRYQHSDGTAATLSEIAAAAGVSSRGSAAHLARLAGTPGAVSPAAARRRAMESLAAAADALGSIDDTDTLEHVLAAAQCLVGHEPQLEPQLEPEPQPATPQLEPEPQPGPEIARPEPEFARPEPQPGPEIARLEPEFARPEPQPINEYELIINDGTFLKSVDGRRPVQVRQRPTSPDGFFAMGEIARLLAPLSTEAARRDMAPVNIATARKAAAGKTRQQVQVAVERILEDLATRPITNVGGLFVHAARTNNSRYFPPARRTPKRSAPAPTKAEGPPVGPDETRRRIAALHQQLRDA